MPSHRKHQTEIIWGIHPVSEALRANRRLILEIFVAGEKAAKRLSGISNQARAQNISIKNVKPEELKRLAGTGRHQDVAARVTPLPLMNFSALLDQLAGNRDDSFFLVIDSVEDPHNLGALIRTALCVGVTGIIIPKDRAASPTPAVSRASAGAMEHAHLCPVTNLVNTMKDMKKHGIWFIGLDMAGEKSIYDTDMKGPRALVIGGEDIGIRRLVTEHCDFLCRIPQTGPVGSLNASVAGAVAMYEAYRQRTVAGQL